MNKWVFKHNSTLGYYTFLISAKVGREVGISVGISEALDYTGSSLNAIFGAWKNSH